MSFFGKYPLYLFSPISIPGREQRPDREPRICSLSRRTSYGVLLFYIPFLVARGQKAEGRSQRSEGRRQKSEGTGKFGMCQVCY